MLVSVIICTYCRPELLGRALQSLDGQIMPSDSELEIIVVDNDPEHSAENTFRSWCSITVHKSVLVFEEKAGLSNARNRGVGVAGGEVIAFLDDDAVAHPFWVEGLVKTFRQRAVDIVTGPVIPVYENPPPAWLERNQEYLLSLIPKFPDGPLPRPYLPAGVNCALRKDVFNEGYRFQTGLGHSKTKIGAGDESELFRGLLKSGRIIWFSNQVAVSHFVPAERMTLDFYKRRLYAEGTVSSLIDLKYIGFVRTCVLGLCRLGYTLLTALFEVRMLLSKGESVRKAAIICRYRKTIGYWKGILCQRLAL